MSKLFFLFFILINLNFAVGQVCEPLPNGIYKAENDSDFSHYPNFEFEIRDSLFISENLKINIEQNDYCVLRLEKPEIEIDENETELSKMLNKQHPFYSISKTSENIYNFILRPDYNLHVISSRGKFIKQ